MTALICWLGSLWLLIKINSSDLFFNQAKSLAFIGLFLGFLLYMVGFICIAGEWFCMWQSSAWNAQPIAGLFLGIILFVMLFLKD